MSEISQGPGDALIAACMLEGFCLRKKKKKEERSSFIGCWLLPDVGITVRSQGSETIPMRIIFTSRFHLGSTVHPCGRSPEFQVSHLSLFCQVQLI